MAVLSQIIQTRYLYGWPHCGLSLCAFGSKDEQEDFGCELARPTTDIIFGELMRGNTEQMRLLACQRGRAYNCGLLVRQKEMKIVHPRNQ